MVRQADGLARVGKVADEFSDYSPLKRGMTGQWQQRAFTLVGRLQFGYDGAKWTEWQAAFADGSVARLSEDNGSYVMSEPLAIKANLPPFDAWRLGATVKLQNQRFTVTSVQQVAMLAAEGELQHLPPVQSTFGMVELRNDGGRVASIDYSGASPQLWEGGAVELTALGLQGIDKASARSEEGRHLNCPNCGGRVEVKLATTKSLTCSSCGSIIDVSQGLGAEVSSALQHGKMEPLIPLGTRGEIDGATWQVVGFQVRQGNSDGDRFEWEEYLLYNRKNGFSFLVDAEDGWSLVRPATGAASLDSQGRVATYRGQRYQQLYAYTSNTSYVLGEFYWKVHRGQTTKHQDFAQGENLLSLEVTNDEVVWSKGRKLSSAKVAEAFKIDPALTLREGDGASSAWLSSLSGMSRLWWIVAIVIVLFVLSALIRACSSCDPQVENCSSSGYRTSGGSYYGTSSGGWHK